MIVSGKAHYNLEWAGTVDPLAAQTPAAESIAAGAEIPQYKFSRVGSGSLWSVVHEVEGDNDQVYFVMFDKAGIGCTCEFFAEHHTRCRHIIALSKLGKSRNDLLTDDAMGAMLMSAGGWTTDKDHVMIPPGEAPSTPPPPKETEKIPPPPAETPKSKKAPTETPKPAPTPAKAPSTPAPPSVPPAKAASGTFDWIEGLVEHGVGQIFGDTGTAKTALCRKIAEDAANCGKKVVYWDSEGNMTRQQRALMSDHENITYILDRDWEHIRSMMDQDVHKNAPKLRSCDLFVLDSIGVPVLGIYGTMKQNKQGAALQGMQGLLYNLTVWAEKHDAVVIVTNQPVSEMNKTKEQIADRHPFGDKAMFFTKEILRLTGGERNEYKTVCHLTAWRSRSAGRGKMIATVTVSDRGTEIEVA